MRPTFLALLVGLVAALPAQSTDAPSRTPPDPDDVRQLPPLARIADVKAMLDEVALPPLPFSTPATPPARFPFTAERLKHYAPDGTLDDIQKNPAKYPLRAGVLRALEMLRKIPTPGDAKGQLSIVQIEAPLNDKQKKSVVKVQDYVAVLVAELDAEQEQLVELGKFRADEPRRWQAHYDYTLAQLRRRLVFVHEYNKTLGDVRREDMPDLPEGSPGWRMVTSDKLRSRADVAAILRKATEGFEAMVAEFKGTPWEALAAQALLPPPGIAWQPIAK
jgi:hypothetical protein